MTIYATEFSGITLQATSPSVDSGFNSMDDVIDHLGKDYRSKTLKMIVYGTYETRVAFTDNFTLHVDMNDINQ